MKQASDTSGKPLVLALGGGAARGWAHVGVIRHLQEVGYDIRGVAGTSIGALVGAFLAAGRLERLQTEIAGYRRRDLLRFIDPVIGGEGLLAGNQVLKFLNCEIPFADIADLRLPFAAVAVDLMTGKEEIFTSGPLGMAVRSSIAIPGVFTPVRDGGKVLVDGGVANPVPVSVARRLVPGVPVCAVDLNGDLPASFRQLPPGGPSQAGRSWMSLLGSKLKGWLRRQSLKTIVPIAGASLVVIEQQLTRARLAADPPDLYVKPDLSAIELVDFHKSHQAMTTGYEAARRVLADSPNH